MDDYFLQFLRYVFTKGNPLVLDWTRGACRPLERDFLLEKPINCEGYQHPNTAKGTIRASGFQMNKNQKSDQKKGPRNRLHTLYKLKCAEPCFGSSKNKPYEICTWSRCRYHRANLGEIADRQTNTRKLFRIWASRLGSPLFQGAIKLVQCCDDPTNSSRRPRMGQ